MFKSATIFFVMVLVILGTVSLFLLERSMTSTGPKGETIRFTVEKGENLPSLSKRLSEAGIIESQYAFMVYAVKSGAYRKLQAGTYSLSGKMVIPEIIESFLAGKVVPPGIRITFPEGFTMQDISKRLIQSNLPGEEFLAIVRDPYPKWRERFPFLREIPDGQSLEGYLFPDTYIFPEQATAELIVNELLENYGKRTEKLREGYDNTAERERLFDWHGLMTLASIVENEVRTKEDRRMVADLFIRRLEIGQALQSDATLRYILGETKVKYSLEETRVVSSYNTYQNPGLPPGPIGNPGLESIEAVLSPLPNEYFYFLNNATTGETVFSKTFEEHVQNKPRNGL